VVLTSIALFLTVDVQPAVSVPAEKMTLLAVKKNTSSEHLGI